MLKLHGRSLKNAGQITDFQLRPIYLGGVMAVSGNKPPMTVAAKGAWMGKDLKRVSEYWKGESFLQALVVDGLTLSYLVHVVPPSPVNGMPPNTSMPYCLDEPS